MTTPLTSDPPPLLKDWEVWLIIGMIVLVALSCLPSWVLAKCAGEWVCSIGGGR